jgi:hypothetical protein
MTGDLQVVKRVKGLSHSSGIIIPKVLHHYYGPGFYALFREPTRGQCPIMLPYSKCKGQYVANPKTAGMWGSQSIGPAILKPLHNMEARGQNQALDA